MKHFIQITLKCYKLLDDCKLNLLVYFLLKLSMIFVSITSAFCLSQIIAKITNQEPLNFEADLILLTISYIVASIIKWIQFDQQQAIEKNSRIRIKKNLLQGLFQSYPKYLLYADSAKANEILYIDSNNVTTLVFSVINMLINIAGIFTLGFLLFKINIYPTAFLTFSLILISMIVLKYSKKIKQLNKELKKETDAHFKLTRDLLRGVKYIEISNSNEFHLERYADNLNHVKNMTMTTAKKAWTLGFFTSMIEYVWVVLILGFGLRGLKTGQFDAASFILFLSYSRIYSKNITTLFDYYSQIQQTVVSIERVFNLTEYFHKENCSENVPFPSNVKQIKISHLNFSYGDNVIFSDFNQNIQKKLVLIVGENGAGKTTLFNLLVGIQSAQKGNIFFDDVPVDCITRNSLRNEISYAPQDDIIFDMTIRENILSFDGGRDISDSTLYEVCANVGILNDILNLPERFDTKIEEIRDFSYGQKKKMLLVRAFLRPAQILLLDEPLAGLDEASQDNVKKYILSLASDKTILIASHKKESFWNCDDMLIIHL